MKLTSIYTKEPLFRRTRALLYSQTEFYTASYSSLPTTVENGEIGCFYSSEGLTDTRIILGWVSSEADTETKICVKVVSLEMIQGRTDKGVGT